MPLFRYAIDAAFHFMPFRRFHYFHTPLIKNDAAAMSLRVFQLDAAIPILMPCHTLPCCFLRRRRHAAAAY